MNEQFLFFCTNIGNESFLKEEIRIFHPELTLSYSRKGFITFKNKGTPYDLEGLLQFKVTFATRMGICLGKSNPDLLLESVTKSLAEFGVEINKCTIHSFSLNTDFCLESEKIFEKKVNEYSPINKTVIDVIALSDKEVWYGIHKVGKQTSHFPNSNPGIEIPKESPSRAYLKIAEAFESFNLNCDKSDQWLDFGSSPGGASYFLLDKGFRVFGIDPAQTSSVVSNHPNYSHLSTPVQDLSQEELPEGIRWVNVELNLNPKQSIKEVLRLCKKYNFTLKGILLTIQIIKIDHVKNIKNFENHFYEWGFKEVVSCQLPSHKKEYVVFAKK